MVCAQVMGNDVTINIAGSSGNFELNVAKPLIIHTFVQSARLLADATHSFHVNLVAGMQPNRDRIAWFLEQSLMLVTALTRHIGYDPAARIARDAHERGITLKEAALASGLVSERDFDHWVRPERMLGPISDAPER